MQSAIFIHILHVFFLYTVDGRDYNSSRATNNTHTFTVVEDSIYVAIPIIDNHRRDGQRFFLFGITSDCGIDIWLQIFIWDDEQGIGSNVYKQNLYGFVDVNYVAIYL